MGWGELGGSQRRKEEEGWLLQAFEGRVRRWGLSWGRGGMHPCTFKPQELWVLVKEGGILARRRSCPMAAGEEGGRWWDELPRD